MRKETIEQAIDGLDPAYIEEYLAMQEALAVVPKKPMAKWVRLIPIAAAMMGVTVILAAMWPSMRRDEEPRPPLMSGDTAETMASTSSGALCPEESAPEDIEGTEPDLCPEESAPGDIGETEPDLCLEETATSTESELPDPNEPTDDTVPLFFKQYADLVAFGTTGHLDPAVYPNAAMLVGWYAFSPHAFMDVRDILGLSDPTLRGWEEDTLIQERNTYDYSVYARDASDRLTLQYRVNYRYDAAYETADRTYSDKVTPVESLSDINGRSGTFLYRINGVDVLYLCTPDGFAGLTLNGGGRSLQIEFGTAASLSPAEIAERCGPTVGDFFADELADVQAHVERFAAYFAGI